MISEPSYIPGSANWLRSLDDASAIFVNKRSTGLPESLTIGVNTVKFGSSMRYLGILIDIRWNFNDHFKFAEQKANKIIRSLNKSIPNLRGPDEKRRRLYANVVMSILLCGAPMWADALTSSKLSKSLVRLEKSIAQRVISAYRTVSGDVTLLLARIPPLREVRNITRESEVAVMLKD
ncbi:uncharacterized protein [Polyergus mexicanus]|uniref:uncharacterized protein n=1 Tax=Polyergus mexicanus TaxID=615972 RepID=UPI0038B674BA